jgi:hypothetical protein
MRALSIVGCVLIVLGILSLAYFASPLRILLQASLGQQKLHLLIPTMSGAAILIGVAILYAVRPRAIKDKK